jgi:hypothetical protein
VDDKTSKKESYYYMIVVTDVLCYIGITLNGDGECLHWDEHELPLINRSNRSLIRKF